MTTDTEKPSAESTIRATSSVLGLLPQIAGFVVGFTSVAYITGWREASAYYQEIGAPWVMSLLSPIQIMQTSIWLISLIALVILISVLQLAQGNASQKGLRRWAIIFLFLAALLLAAPLVLKGRISAAATLFIAGATSISWAISAGLTIGELIACLAKDELKWGEYHIFLLYFVILYGLLQAPSNMGSTRAKLAIDPVSSTLPKVSFNSNSNIGEWRLVTASGDRLLLVSLAINKHDLRFKLVDPSEIKEIFAHGKK